MTDIPSILIVSCSSTKPKSLVKLITKAPEVEPYPEAPTVVKHQWRIDTKYYTTDVNVFGFEDDFERPQKFNENVEALIVHMDSNKSSGLDDLIKWDDLRRDCNLEVKLLVSNYCTDNTKITKSEALEWCLGHGFEFIELYPSTGVSDDDEDDFQEKFGVERIIEALQSHTWPNLVMKNKSKKAKQVEKTGTDDDAGQELRQLQLDDVADDFTDLFSQLHVMKDSLQSMPMGQRKQCAEQMVTAFWKAIGGEEEEIFDL